MDWDNETNLREYYSKPEILEVLKGFAEFGGLDTCPDLELFWDKICDSESLIEVGPGYGRIIKRLLEKGYAGSIDAVEHSPVFCQELNTQFGNKITLHQQSILEFETDRLYDAVISMWSGISDFNPQQQVLFMQKLAGLLAKNGLLIMDVSVAGQKPSNAIDASSEQEYCISTEGRIIKGYVPSKEELTEYAATTNLELQTFNSYQTTKNRERNLAIFRRKN